MAVEQVIKISLDDLKALGGIDNLKKSLGRNRTIYKVAKTAIKRSDCQKLRKWLKSTERLQRNCSSG